MTWRPPIVGKIAPRRVKAPVRDATGKFIVTVAVNGGTYVRTTKESWSRYMRGVNDCLWKTWPDETSANTAAAHFEREFIADHSLGIPKINVEPY